MSKPALRKALRDIDKEGIVELLCELYDARPQAREYLDFWAKPDLEKLDEKYRSAIRKIFFIGGERPRKNPSLTDIRSAIKFFSTLCCEPEKTASLMLYAADSYREWLSTRRHILSHRARADALLAETRAYIESHALEEFLSLPLERIEKGIAEVFRRGDPPRRRWGWGW